MNWSLGNYWFLLLLLVVPAIGFLIINFFRWRSRKKDMFAESRFQNVLFQKRKPISKIFPIIYLLAIIFLIFSMVDVLGGKEEVEMRQKMNNVIFLFDVSNSMNAEDIQLNRITQAKDIMQNVLPKLHNSRVGIVVFAGEANSIMPLTSDYTAAETYIDAIDTGMIKIQGTDFLKAIKKSVDKFKNVPKGSRQIVLISDGEDNEGKQQAAIEEARNEEISVIAVGIGTEEGAPVPQYVSGQLMGYKTYLTGETVISKRKTEALKEIASDTGGTYIDGNNLENAVNQITENVRKINTSSSSFVKSENSIHYYQYFLAVSLFLFLVVLFFNSKKDFDF